MPDVPLDVGADRTALLTDDPERVDVDVLWDFLSTQAYWGRWRTRADLTDQLNASWRVVSAHVDRQMVAFARAVSDGVALAYLADVFVVDAWRGKGIGAALVAFMVDDGPGADFRWMLHTADAHRLYERVGFAAPPATYLERPGRNS
jgi:predicted GNAT family acetyltransferase